MTQQMPSLNGMRLLMTVDAIGGVWRYAMDLASGLRRLGVETLFVCLGPAPSDDKVEEASRIGRLVHLDAPLDWLAADRQALADLPARIAKLGCRERAEVLHLNLPSQAADIATDIPVVTVSHSCVVTWFSGVRNTSVPEDWRWQQELNRAGFDHAAVVVSPSASHAAMLDAAYGTIPQLRVVYNGSRLENALAEKQDLVFAAGRWWDDGKNGAVLEEAAPLIRWPLLMAGANAGPNGQHLLIEHALHRGELTHSQTVSLMREAKIVVSPSVYEPFGLAPLEAARAGAALVLSDIPTYRELWSDCACFFDPHDPQALAAAVNRLGEDADLRAGLAVKAYDRSLDFTIDAQTQAMARIYAELRTQNKTLTAAE
ncbi:glycosyltransferase involved in cell wall biosynthesis [Pseudorhizobium tarimense]|uniref:Glycosyltransferase involved in cell wall biosynthesis n=1 Tax=Pseudorhizobium tarimense TaxID=1079109 RepID=A0ABV2H3B4_9HYPH|nr:glycosyltransferase family 4 protein [Pseudorhizobium tarimense]MCJ8518234.1 glycosyltransferase family 4 protein [Pseudorhizobium tarimense]